MKHSLTALFIAAGTAVFSGMSVSTAQEFYPRDAGSWGGKVRSGPGTEYRRIDGLREGAPVRLLRNSGVMMNGYPWFEISFKNGRRGYKWGGILCSFGDPIPGLYQTCTSGSQSTDDPNPPRQGPRGTDPLDFPIQAASGGGIVRSGPGTKYRKVTSLTQFEPITVQGLSGVMMNGYPWFTIVFRNGKTGYHWGGLICSTDTEFVGTFDTCANFRRSLSGNNSGNAPKPNADFRNDLTYVCNQGVPLTVSFRDEGNSSFALFSYDRGPTKRVESQRTGSGFSYTDGYHSLRGKGSTIIVSENGRELNFCRAQ